MAITCMEITARFQLSDHIRTHCLTEYGSHRNLDEPSLFKRSLNDRRRSYGKHRIPASTATSPESNLKQFTCARYRRSLKRLATRKSCKISQPLQRCDTQWRRLFYKRKSRSSHPIFQDHQYLHLFFRSAWCHCASHSFINDFCIVQII
jgi:hypothetical protein